MANRFTPASDRINESHNEIRRDMRLIAQVALIALFAVLCVSLVQGSENWKSTRIAHVEP